MECDGKRYRRSVQATMSNMKLYKLNRPLFLREATAERLGVNNRLYQEGEEIELPDDIAEMLLEKGTLEAVPEPPAPKKQPAKKTEVKKESEGDK